MGNHYPQCKESKMNHNWKNIRIALNSSEQKWQLALIGKNLTVDDMICFVRSIPG
jgi:hypothetical protein